MNTVKIALELGSTVGRILRFMAENASISLNGLLGIWTLKKLTYNSSKGSKTHVIGNWRELWHGRDLVKICPEVMRTELTNDRLGCSHALHDHSLVSDRPPI